MSLYNALFGVNDQADVLLATLGLTRADVGRFRDCYLSENTIAIYTRMGGGNREDYEESILTLQSHPNYLEDEDDDYDCTYATFYFSFPDEYKAVLDELSGDNQSITPTEKWEQLLTALKKL